MHLSRLPLLILLVAGSFPAACARGDESPIYKNPAAPVERRVEALFQAMTEEERESLLAGAGFTTQPVPRLGIPPMAMVDASQGVRGGSDTTKGDATSFGASVLLSSTWDPDLTGRVGHAVGVEALNKGTGAQILLGPGINIMHTPLGGRTGEYLGEDPYHSARMAVAYIKGLQETGCSACVKHFACNNQEFDRNGIDEQVSERALRELYLPAFLAAVTEGKVWCVMSAYNKVNGAYCSANPDLQKKILKGEAGFDGIIMSDWGGVHATGAIQNGCDLEMPKGPEMSPKNIGAALRSRTLSQQNVDDAVRRVIRTIIRVGLLDGPRKLDPSLVGSVEHQRLAQEVAEKGIVLLKNEKHILPLDAAKIHSIALIGPACKVWQMSTNGSGKVVSSHAVSAYDTIVGRAGSAVKITYSEGYNQWYTGEAVPASVLQPSRGNGEGLSGEYFAGESFQGSPAIVRLDPKIDLDFSKPEERPAGVAARHFCVRWTGRLTPPATGTYRMNVDASAGARLFIDGKLVQDTWPGFDGSAIAGVIHLVAGRSVPVRLEYMEGGGGRIRWSWLPPGRELFAREAEIASHADVAIVFVGSGGEGEFVDRRSMALPGVQDEMIRAVAAANPHTVVVLNNGGPVLVSDWLDSTPAVLEAYFPGEAGGIALAHILFGDINPSGKLVYTMARKREDYPDFGHYPIDLKTLVLSGSSNPAVNYAEGIYVGYRHFDKNGIQPSFPFGFGLSYTSFAYSNMKLSAPALEPGGKITISAEITNTGLRRGAEVAQLYVRADQPSIDRPPRELKGSARVELKPGEKKMVDFSINARDLAYYDVAGHQWKADAGSYTLELGGSSRNIDAKAGLILSADVSLPP